MNAKTQLTILIISFIFGFFSFYLFKLNNILIKNKKKIYQSLITMLFMYNIVLIYIIIIFYTNHGKFHLYFFIMITLGIYTNYKLHKKMLNNKKYNSFIEKIKKKCYTNNNRGDKN